MVGGNGVGTPSEVSRALDEVFAPNARISPYAGVGDPTAQSPEAWTQRFGAIVKDIITKSH